MEENDKKSLEEIQKDVDVFFMSMEILQDEAIINDIDKLDNLQKKLNEIESDVEESLTFEHIKKLPLKVKHIMSKITKGNKVIGEDGYIGDANFLEGCLQYIRFLDDYKKTENNLNLEDMKLAKLYKDLQVLGTPYTHFLNDYKKTNNKYIGDSEAKAKYKEKYADRYKNTPQDLYDKLFQPKYIQLTDSDHPEQTMKMYPALMPYIQAYIFRNEWSHRGDFQEASAREHVEAILFTCVECMSLVANKVKDKYEMIHFKDIFKNYILNIIKEYETNMHHLVDGKFNDEQYYLPFNCEFAVPKGEEKYKSLTRNGIPGAPKTLYSELGLIGNSDKINNINFEEINKLVDGDSKYAYEIYSLKKDKQLNNNEKIKNIQNNLKIKFDNKLHFNIIKVIGYAGMGKTTFLEHITYNELKKLTEQNVNNELVIKNLKQKDFIVPVMIRLCDINQNNCKAPIEKMIKDIINPNIPQMVIDNLLEQGLINVYFDGLNEINLTGEELTEFINKINSFVTNDKYKNNKIIVTDRDSNANSILESYPKLNMNGVHKENIMEFVKKNATRYYQKSEEEEYLIAEKAFEIFLQNDIPEKYKEALSKPLFLRKLITIAESGRNIPVTYNDVIKEFITSLIERERDEKRNENAQNIDLLLTEIVKKYGKENGFCVKAFSVNFKDAKNYLDTEIIAKGGLYNDYGELIKAEDVLKLSIGLGLLELIGDNINFVEEAYFDYYYKLAFPKEENNDGDLLLNFI